MSYYFSESQQTKYFSTFKLLKQHYAKVHASRNLACDACKDVFANAVLLKTHMKICGQGKDYLFCTMYIFKNSQ